MHAEEVHDGIVEFLGYGYKGYEYFATCDSCTKTLFDLTDETNVEIQDGSSWKGRFASGDNKSEFFSDYFAGASISGKTPLFSGDLTAKFSKSVLNNRAHSFATSLITQSYYRLKLKENVPLKTKVVQYLNTLPAKALFDKYGTHYLNSIYIGGRITFSSHIDRSKVEENSDIKAAINASYNQTVSSSASGGSRHKNTIEQLIKNKTVEVYGGDPALAANVQNSIGKPSESYKSGRKLFLNS